ncbi:MAG: bacteriohemerythrin [Planctomycetota bacterium]
MSLACWKDEYSVHVAEIDGQHKQFFTLINKLDKVKNGDRAALGIVLNELLDYATYHFSAEERLLEQCAYPQSEDHKGRHRKFITKAVLIKKDFDRGKDIEPNEVMDWAGSWLIRHILGRDQRYVPYVSRD